MDFFEEYFNFVGESEAPTIYHRWCSLSILSTLLARDVYIKFGHQTIFPNQYLLLLGAPAARKNTAIGIATRLLREVGYKRFAKDQTSKERFFVDLVHKVETDTGIDEGLETLVLDAPSETMIAKGEFLDFIGQNNMPFLTSLTNLWDCPEEYEHPKLHGRSVVIPRPTINILGGATVKGLGLAIPQEAIGTGILSRLLLIYGEPSGKQITFPREVEIEEASKLKELLLEMKLKLKGKMEVSEEAKEILDRMYKTFPGIDDGRFSDYTGRRFIHLLKISMCISASNLRLVIEVKDVLQANTILHAAETAMPKALGEFGQSKYSNVSNTIMEYLNKAIKPVKHQELWKLVAKDLNDQRDLTNIMVNLRSSEKIQVMAIDGKAGGYLPIHKEVKNWDEDLLLSDFLREGE